MKGIINFYINFPKYDEGTISNVMRLIREENADIIKHITEGNKYLVMFIPTQNESSRIEKVDFDLPFPRYVAPHMDITKHEQMVSNAIAATAIKPKQEEE